MSLPRPMPPRAAPHVAIIGAGLAGLRCADILLRRGSKVTIFEARNRIGGRVHQISTGGHLLDLGPNWIHGTVGNPILQMAEKTSTITFEPEEASIIFDSAGRPKSQTESTKLGVEVWATIFDAFRHSDEHYRDIDPEKSLMDFFEEEVAKRFPSEPQKTEEILKEANMWSFYVGETMKRQSLRCFFLEQCLNGKDLFVASTYQQILAEVGKKAVQDANIKLNEPVVAIEYKQSTSPESKVVVRTATGTYAAFDEVVVTCPLGWLKRNQDAFIPRLPNRLSEAIHNISYGRLEKIYVTFPSAFWLGDNHRGLTSQKSNDASSPSAVAADLPAFVRFQHPHYHPDPASRISEQWDQSVVSLAHLPSSAAHPTLLFYLYGDSGSHLTSLLADHPVQSAKYNEIVFSFARPFFSKLPNYSADNPQCVPTSLLSTSWQTDSFAGFGSYSNFQVGLVDGAADIETMRDAGGLSDEGRGLWFAGEHTAPFVALGTTTGAYWSGEAVANRIAQAYRLDVRDDDAGAVSPKRKEL